jgi:hypothetical protein
VKNAPRKAAITAIIKDATVLIINVRCSDIFAFRTCVPKFRLCRPGNIAHCRIRHNYVQHNRRQLPGENFEIN